MNRREFLKFSSCGVSFVAVGSTLPLLLRGNPAYAQLAPGSALELDMVEVDAQMVDGITTVPMWAFEIDASSPLGAPELLGLPRIPGPALFALEGDTVRLRVRNRIPNGGPHAFAIPGVVETGPLEDGDRELVEFTAPRAGTYVYLDPLNAPVNRVMGLHGVLVVLPNPVGNFTPYSDPTPRVRDLFNDLGRADRGFPGHPWDSARNAIWVFNTVDPVKNAAAFGSEAGLSPQAFLDGYLPQYFTLNGKSGFFSAQHHGDGGDHTHENLLDRFTFDLQANISISGRVGQPILIRNVNAGLMWHSPHIHGNHVYYLARSDYLTGTRTVFNNVLMLDTWTNAPGTVEELLLPFIRPPDIPGDRQVVDAQGAPMGRTAWPPVQEKFPLFYPMHDHNEISNTAAGGNYPHGLVTHWQIDGDIDTLAAVIQVEQAEYRVRSGRIVLEGRSSTPNIHLSLHPGDDMTTMLGEAHVDGQGRWSFRGRSLRVLADRLVTLMFHDPGDPAVVHASRTVRLNLR